MSVFHALLASATLIGLTPAPPDAASGERALRAGDFVGASSRYDAEAPLHGNDPAWLSGAARLALYENRLDDAKRLFERLAGDAAHKAAAERGLAEIAARRGTDGTFVIDDPAAGADIPFAAGEPLPIVTVTLNGTRVARFLIDTGAPGVVISPSVAKELGVETVDAGPGVFAGGGAGRVKAGRLASLNLGAVRIRAIPAMVSPFDGAPAPPGMKVDGILGTSVFYHFLTTLDYRKGHLSLQPRDRSDAFQRDAVQQGACIARMWYVPDHFIFVRAKVNGRFDGLFNVDTGGEGVGIQATKATLEGAKVSPDAKHPGHFGTPRGDVETLPFSADVSLGGCPVTTAPGVYFPGGDHYGIFPFTVAGTVSDRLFRGTALTFDFVAMRMVVARR